MYFARVKNGLYPGLTYRLFCTICLTMALNIVQAQLCSDPADTIYGLTTAGQVVAINVNAAAGSTAIGSPSAGASNTNGVGYNQSNKSFYYFNISGGAAGSQQFISYNPATSTKTVLAAPPATVLAADQIRSGCNTQAGTGYYMIDPLTTPHATLYYYNVTLNTWTTITSSLKDASGNPAGDLDSLVSGDMAFDGSGDLWIVAASKYNWALYTILASVPTTATASVTVQKIIPVTANPAAMFNKISFTGIAFNSSGHLYLASGNGAGGNNLYELTSSSATSLSLVHSILNDYGADLTSCSFPVSVLPVVWVDFSAVTQHGGVDLRWEANEYGNVSRYEVEYSSDGEHWQTIAHIAGAAGHSGDAMGQSYAYTIHECPPGLNYYRISQVSVAGEESISLVKAVNGPTDRVISIGPNPAKDELYIFNRDQGSKYLAQFFDVSGRLVLSRVIDPGQASIDISGLPRGAYLVRLVSASNEAGFSTQLIKK